MTHLGIQRCLDTSGHVLIHLYSRDIYRCLEILTSESNTFLDTLLSFTIIPTLCNNLS